MRIMLINMVKIILHKNKIFAYGKISGEFLFDDSYYLVLYDLNHYDHELSYGSYRIKFL